TELLKTSRHYRHVISSLEAEEAARTGAIPIVRDEQAEIHETVQEGLREEADDEAPGSAPRFAGEEVQR
ncbi:hypothetical protein, partial [Mycobacterium tuberculosis]|uniref:hypothetical protein n=1 Tax=Mycobacterium tuberculosis TaxID=1773 RepID=UPI000A91C236